MSKGISGSTGPIFMIFSPNGRYLREFSRSDSIFPIPQGTLPWQPILWQNYLPPVLITMAFRNGMGHCYLNVRINSKNDASTGCAKKYRNTKMLISHKCVNILIPNFPRLLNTHFFTIDVFFIYLLNTLLSSEEIKSMFNFRYSTLAQHDQQCIYP